MELILTPSLYFEGNFLHMREPWSKVNPLFYLLYYHHTSFCSKTSGAGLITFLYSRPQKLKVILTETGFVKKYYQAYKRHFTSTQGEASRLLNNWA